MIGLFRNFGAGELLVIIFLGIFFVPFIWALVDVLRRPQDQFPPGQKKTSWLLGILLGWFVALGWLVGIIYLVVVRQAAGPVKVRPLQPPGTPGTPSV